MEGMKINVVLMSVVFVICISGCAAKCLEGHPGSVKCIPTNLQKWDDCLNWTRFIALKQADCKPNLEHCEQHYEQCIKSNDCGDEHHPRWFGLTLRSLSILYFCRDKGSLFDANRTKTCFQKFYGDVDHSCKKQHFSDRVLVSRLDMDHYELCGPVGKWKCCVYHNLSTQCGKAPAAVIVKSQWRGWGGDMWLSCESKGNMTWDCIKEHKDDKSSRAGPFGMTDGGPAPLLLMTSLLTSLLAAGGPRLLLLMTSLMTSLHWRP